MCSNLTKNYLIKYIKYIEIYKKYLTKSIISFVCV